ncbi:phage head closure protein [Solimicrobium silvestre]|uniref:Putative phage head-tail adaptor n=1 Tax=Solimicrobium silvestre TaxID=2099400 RepID=A0A2S9GZC7_9BURK|nr:phage head closure protein [Solimicrobium silvestre]PRC93084.1 putative phage head-tail adaptor [Solimicrobium silvestre]
MNSGQLNRRITIQAASTKQDALGQPIDGWSEVATVWAGITDINGREFIAAAAVQNTVQTKIIIRYRAGITPAMRVLHKDSIYNIEAVLGQDNVWLNLMCSKEVNNG